MGILAALCDVLECTPNDLIEIKVVDRQLPKAVGGEKANEVPPVRRSMIRRPRQPRVPGPSACPGRRRYARAAGARGGSARAARGRHLPPLLPTRPTGHQGVRQLRPCPHTRRPHFSSRWKRPVVSSTMRETGWA
ncbi:helix-turn-helix domain-containing protein [Streptomyces avermitilis]|uniref:helix-turn-helix domain-containing protein n=1 Tax=Streptomyces avermitilis TaxID=33903 RepID=UPI003F52C73F